MDDQDVYDSIGAVCIDCYLPYDLCNCPLDYVDEDEFCPTQDAVDLPLRVAQSICSHCDGVGWCLPNCITQANH